MKIELTKEEWITIRAAIFYSMTDKYIMDIIPKQQQENYYSTLEKLGKEWKDED